MSTAKRPLLKQLLSLGGALRQKNANDYLKAIRQPTLVVAGSNDIVFYTVNDVTLQQHLPNAQLVIYPGSNHGAIYQYPDLFIQQASAFLNAAK